MELNILQIIPIPHKMIATYDSGEQRMILGIALVEENDQRVLRFFEKKKDSAEICLTNKTASCFPHEFGFDV